MRRLLRVMKHFCLFLFAYASLVSAGDRTPTYKHLANFAVPKQFYSEQDFHPVTYIESLPIADPSAKLQSGEAGRLALLFIAVDDACRSKYRQGYYIGSALPAVRLLIFQFPDLIAKRLDGDHFYTGDIADYLKTRYSRHARK
jgi:hypothetical protein